MEAKASMSALRVMDACGRVELGVESGSGCSMLGGSPRLWPGRANYHVGKSQSLQKSIIFCVGFSQN